VTSENEVQTAEQGRGGATVLNGAANSHSHWSLRTRPLPPITANNFPMKNSVAN